jgi:proteasome assembly chaperone (PAC2) family protein
MGQVALTAATYLVSRLGGRKLEEIVRAEYFDVATVGVHGGVVKRPSPPKSTLFGVDAPGGGGPAFHILVGEAQPTTRSYEFCHELIDLALARNVKRIVTFAALATPVHPSATPQVIGVASEAGLLEDLARVETSLLNEGQISGVNGVLVAAAAERGVEAICLLGELPFFAIGVPNPKSALAVLRSFERLSGVAVELTELEQQARLVEKALLDLVERARRAQEEKSDEGQEGEFKAPEPEEEESKAPPPNVLERIEALFARARADKSRALELKAELDRLGLFRQYEDRFLDLFKREEHS